MARFLCVCGHQMSTSGPIPHPDQWQCLSDTDYDAFTGIVDVEVVYRRSTVMFRCPRSDHLWIFWDGFAAEPSLYAPTSTPTPTSDGGG